MRIVTFHKPRCHQLYIDGLKREEAPTEIELVSLAKKHGIDFKKLSFKTCGAGYVVRTEWTEK